MKRRVPGAALLALVLDARPGLVMTPEQHCHQGGQQDDQKEEPHEDDRSSLDYDGLSQTASDLCRSPANGQGRPLAREDSPRQRPIFPLRRDHHPTTRRYAGTQCPGTKGAGSR